MTEYKDELVPPREWPNQPLSIVRTKLKDDNLERFYSTFHPERVVELVKMAREENGEVKIDRILGMGNPGIPVWFHHSEFRAVEPYS